MSMKIALSRHLRSAVAIILWSCAGTAAIGQSSSPINQWLLIDGCSTQHTYKIATLPESTDGTYDYLHLTATLSTGWFSLTDSTIDVTFANRGGFKATYTARGANPIGATTAHLVAYRNAADAQSNDGLGSVDLYVAYSGCAFASYAILQSVQELVYSSPSDLGSAVPPGTIVFDTASTLPANFTDFSGNLGVGTTTPGADLSGLSSPPASGTPILEVNGDIALTQGGGGQVYYPDGTVQSTAWNGVLSGGDYAESVDVGGDRERYQPGDVLVIDSASEGRFLKSSQPYSTAVTGIYSTKPGLVGRRQLTDRSHMKAEVPMAMTGIVPIKVSAENGPIKVGDLLVTSSTTGYAMKGTDRSQMLGAVIGKALGHLDSGKGMIEGVVTLQ